MNRTALICDDTMFMRSVITQVLVGAGWEVIGEFEDLCGDFRSGGVDCESLHGDGSVPVHEDDAEVVKRTDAQFAVQHGRLLGSHSGHTQQGQHAGRNLLQQFLQQRQTSGC